MAAHLLPIEEPDNTQIPLEGSVLQAFKNVDDVWLKTQKIHTHRHKDDKK